jgi:hypothetical protein
MSIFHTSSFYHEFLKGQHLLMGGQQRRSDPDFMDQFAEANKVLNELKTMQNGIPEPNWVLDDEDSKK